MNRAGLAAIHNCNRSKYMPSSSITKGTAFSIVPVPFASNHVPDSSPHNSPQGIFHARKRQNSSSGKGLATLSQDFQRQKISESPSRCSSAEAVGGVAQERGAGGGLKAFLKSRKRFTVSGVLDRSPMPYMPFVSGFRS